MVSGVVRMLAVIGLLVLAGCGSSQEKAAKAAAHFDNYYARRDYYSARVEIRRALAAQEDVPEYWAKLARVQLAMGHYLEAYDAYRHVVELDKNNAEAIQSMAELSYSGGSLDDAAKFADQILAQQPRSLRMLLIKGSIAAAQHQVPDARAVAEKMLTIDPSNEGATILLARVQMMENDADAAIRTIEASVARDGETVAKLTVLLDLYASRDDFPNTARAYARLFRLSPDDVELRLEYAKTLYEQGRPDRALAMLDRLTRAHPGDAALEQRIVDMWTEVGSAAVDIDRVRRFVAAQGGGPMKVALGQLLVEGRRYADAEAELRPFIDGGTITAANVEADVLYAGALAGLGQGPRAVALIDNILAFDESNPRALLMRVRISLARGDLVQALRDAQLLTRDNPAMVEGRVALAQIYVRRKERILADSSYAQAMNALPDDSGMLTAYVAYLLDTGRGPIARDIVKRFTSDNARSREGWREQARLCLRLGDDACVQDAFHALDQIPGGAKIRHALEAVRAPPAAKPPAMFQRGPAAKPPAMLQGGPAAKPPAGQITPSCGRTGGPC